eukprot:Gb_14690 [translate_table: standard]
MDCSFTPREPSLQGNSCSSASEWPSRLTCLAALQPLRQPTIPKLMIRKPLYMVSPKQKPLVTEPVHQDGHKVCLSIGDGAKDVGTMQKINIGVGINGFEDQQATMATGPKKSMRYSWKLALWLVNGIIQAFLPFSTILLSHSKYSGLKNGKMVDLYSVGTTMSTSIVFTVNLQMAIAIQYGTWIRHAVIWGEIAIGIRPPVRNISSSFTNNRVMGNRNLGAREVSPGAKIPKTSPMYFSSMCGPSKKDKTRGRGVTKHSSQAVCEATFTKDKEQSWIGTRGSLSKGNFINWEMSFGIRVQKF